MLRKLLYTIMIMLLVLAPHLPLARADAECEPANDNDCTHSSTRNVKVSDTTCVRKIKYKVTMIVTICNRCERVVNKVSTWDEIGTC